FAYARPGTLAEAFDLLERHGERARILAGGQSLIPSLNMRLSSPGLLVDITGIPGLSKIEASAGGGLRIGALVTHAQIEKSPDVRKHAPLLAQAAPHIAHPAIRNRGTLGGSLALADPAAEYPACALALNATFIVLSKKGERRVKATEFFKGLFETDLKSAEILAAAEFPAVDKSAFVELARRHGDYAIVGLAAVRTGSQKRFAFLGAGATPVLAVNASKASSLEEARQALEKDLDPPADLYHSSPTKLHLAGVQGGHDRGPLGFRRAEGAAKGLSREERAAVRLLHAGNADGRPGSGCSKEEVFQRRDQKPYFRQLLPLHGLPGHRRRHRAGIKWPKLNCRCTRRGPSSTRATSGKACRGRTRSACSRGAARSSMTCGFPGSLMLRSCAVLTPTPRSRPSTSKRRSLHLASSARSTAARSPSTARRGSRCSPT